MKYYRCQIESNRIKYYRCQIESNGSLAESSRIRIENLSFISVSGENSHWNADGTFCTAPTLFTQVYYIHVWNEFSMKPVVFACREDKSQEGYHRLFTSLVTYANTKNISLNPSSISIDFEQATINAINDVFQQASVKGCHFHYAKNVWKKIKNYSLVKLSKQENIRRQIANIISLPLISPNEINNSMEKIIDELCDVNFKFDKLTDYIINNYINDGRFSLCMRNHFDTIGERPRTNNHLEGCPRQLSGGP